MNSIKIVFCALILSFLYGCDDRDLARNESGPSSFKESVRVTLDVSDDSFDTRSAPATNAESLLGNVYLFFYRNGAETADLFIEETGLDSVRTWSRLLTEQNSPSMNFSESYEVFALANLRSDMPRPTASMTRTELLGLEEERPNDRALDGSDISFSGRAVYNGGDILRIRLFRTVARLDLSFDFSATSFPNANWVAIMNIANEHRFTPFFRKDLLKPDILGIISLERWKITPTSYRYYLYPNMDTSLVLISGTLIRDGSVAQLISFRLDDLGSGVFNRNRIYRVNIKPTDSVMVEPYIESFTLHEGYAFFDIQSGRIDTVEVALTGNTAPFVLKKQPDGQATPNNNYTDIVSNRQTLAGGLSKTRFRVDMRAAVNTRASIAAASVMVEIRVNGRLYRNYPVSFTPVSQYHTTIINGVEWMNHNPSAYTLPFLDWDNSTGFLYRQGNNTPGPISSGIFQDGLSLNTTPWSSNPQGPCPAGYRVPSQAAFLRWIANNPPGTYPNGTYGNINLSWMDIGPDARAPRSFTKITDLTNSNVLYLPSVGFRAVNGVLVARGFGYYMQSTINDVRQRGSSFVFTPTVAAFSSINNGVAASVRCIKR